MKNPGQYRQGDVFIERVTTIPTQIWKQETSRRVILAHGEMTGHHHVLEAAEPADWWKEGEISTADKKPVASSGALFLSLPTGGTVTHEEHATIELPPGDYRAIRQREYSPQAVRNVAD